MLSSLAVETLPKLRFTVSKRERDHKSEEGEHGKKVQGSGPL